MKDMLKKMLVVMAIAAVCAVPELKAQEAEAAPADSGIGLSIGLDYMSNYLWRGTYWYGGNGAFFPSVSYDVLGSGLTIGVCGELSEAWIGDMRDDNEDIQAFDIGADYSKSFGPVTLGVGVWYYMMKESDYSLASGYVSLSLDTVPLTPTLTYNHDYYTGDSDVVGDEAKDFYVTLGLSKSFELMKDAAFDLGAQAGYYSMKSFGSDLSGISDIDLSAAFSVTKGIATYSSSFHYVIVPGGDYVDYGLSYKDYSRFYATFGVSCSI